MLNVSARKRMKTDVAKKLRPRLVESRKRLRQEQRAKRPRAIQKTTSSRKESKSAL